MELTGVTGVKPKNEVRKVKGATFVHQFGS